MARGFGMTALRAALGGVAGGLEGLGAMREEERVRKEAEAAKQRQAAMDRVALLNQGFMTDEETAAERQRTGSALSRTLSSVTSMMRPGGLGAGMALQEGDLRRVAAAPGMEGPQQTVTLGGVSYRREPPFAKAAREAEQDLARTRIAAEAERARQRQEQEVQERALVAMGLSKDQAKTAVSMGAKYGDVVETPGDKQRRLLADREYNLNLRRVQLAEREAQKDDGQQQGPATFGDAANYFSNLTQDAVKKLSTIGIYSARTAQTISGVTGGALDVAGTASGKITPAEREYLDYAGSVADAWARKSEVGTLTENDINRYRNMVLFQAGDTEADKWRRVQRAQKWSAALAQMGSAPEDEGGQSEQNRYSQRVERGMLPADAASLVQRETQGASFGLPQGSRPSLSSIFGR